MTALDPRGAPVRVGSATLRTPGLDGEAKELAGGIRRTRGHSRRSNLDAALGHQDFRHQQTVAFGARPSPRRRGAPAKTLPVELEVPAAPPGFGQVVLHTDEHGIVNWITRPEPISEKRAWGRPTRRYRIPPAYPLPRATRGLGNALVSKLLEVFVFPRIQPIVGAIGEHYARVWEEANRPYRIFRFAPDSYTQPDVPTLSPEEISQLAKGGRTLLLLHGTFGRASSAFASMPPAVLSELYRRYQRRVIAFDHFTITDDPLRNVQRFVDALPPEVSLELDLISHSRGGMVVRAMCERQSDLNLDGRKVTIRNALFAGSPSAGCVLADAKAMSHFIDRYTNWAAWLPTNGVIDIFEGVLAVVKELAVDVFEGLPGLESMDPNGTFLRKLNESAATATHYYALAANYQPKDASLNSFAHNTLMDAIFQQDNDLVVPTAGAWDANGAGSFPIKDRHVFGPMDGVDHGAYFSDSTCQRLILQWLTNS